MVRPGQPRCRGAVGREMSCFAHARRGFFELAYIEKNAREGKKGKPVSPIALEAVRRLDELFEIERAINGRSADERYAVRQEKSKPLLDDMHAWLLRERDTLSRSSEVLKPMNYMLRRWVDFARFIDDGRICLSNNAAEREAQLDIRRFPARRRPRRHHAYPHHHGTPQRRRPESLACRRPGPHCRSSRLASAPTTALGVEAPARSRQTRRSPGRLTSTQRHHRAPPRPRACVPILRPSSDAYGSPS